VLTRLRVRNFKNLGSIDIELGRTTVLVGPNNSGKTSALQALALWKAGVDAIRSRALAQPPRWAAVLNRHDVTFAPVRDAEWLWKDALARMADEAPIPIEIEVHSADQSGEWSFAASFHLENAESILCRGSLALPSPNPSDEGTPLFPDLDRPVAFLPTMSGIAATEPEIAPGRINVLLGEGRTAEVLRNLCLRLAESKPEGWSSVVHHMQAMFAVAIGAPHRNAARGEVVLTYDQNSRTFDISAAGRGMQQTLLLLAHLHANPGAVLLLDEPDAHLEIVRQREIYNVLTDTAAETNSQIVIASHSEAILDEAARSAQIIAFVGVPHTLNAGRKDELLKSLTAIGFSDFQQADSKGAVLYVEGTTDLSILQALADRLDHPARATLERPFVKYVDDKANDALANFYGLREGYPALRGFALFDRPAKGKSIFGDLVGHYWTKQEIENYIVDRDTLLAFAGEDRTRRNAMECAIAEAEQAAEVLERPFWSDDAKISDDVLRPIFQNFFKRLGIRNEMPKSRYHELVAFKDPASIDPEVTEVLDKLLAAIGPAA